MIPSKKDPGDGDAVIDAYKKDVDITLIRENLKLTPHERLLKLIELQRLAQELHRSGLSLHRPRIS